MIAAIMAGALPIQWQRWKWSAPISPARGIAAFSLPQSLEGKARADFGDVRLIDDRATEVPFELVMRLHRTKPQVQQYTAGQRVSQRGSQTVVTVDALGAHVPVSIVRLETGTLNFSRHVTVEYSDDGKVWSFAGNARLKQTPTGIRREIEFPEKHARYWRLMIENENDAPLSAPKAQLRGALRFVIFDSQSGRSYRAIFGNRAASAPSYDFGATHEPAALKHPVAVRAGVPQRNLTYEPRAVPWSESHPWVLWGALGAAVTGIGGLALRVLLTK